MRLLVTRPDPDAEATAEALRRLGHEVMVAPMLTVIAREEQPIELNDIQAICFTSRNGVRVFARRSPERAIPVYVVGPGTAAEARSKGFSAVREGGGDGRSLVERLKESLAPAGGAVLHARGAAVAYDVAGSLRELGFSVREQVLYETLPVPALPPDVRQAWSAGTLEGVLFFSPRSAKTFATLLMDAGLADGAKRVTAFCLSEAVRGASELPWQAVRVAAQPDVPAMLSLLEGDEGAMAEERKTEEQAAPADSTSSESAPAVEEPAAGQGQDERDHVEAIIAKFGGLRPMASKLDLAVSTVQGWKIRGHIPEQRHEEILKAAKEHDIALSAEDLVAPVTASETQEGDKAASPSESKTAEAVPAKAKSSVPTSGARPAAPDTPAEAPADEKAEVAKTSSAASAAATASAAPPPPPPAADHGRRGGFMPGLLVGALLFAGGAVAAFQFRDAWLPMVDGASQAEAVDPVALDQRLQALSGDIAAMRQDIAALGERAGGLEAAVASAAQGAGPEDIAALGEDIAALQQALEGVEQGLSGDVDALAAELGMFAESVAVSDGKLEEALAALSQQTDRLTATAAENKAEVQQLSGAVTALGVEGLRSETAGLSEALAALDARTGAVEEQLGQQQSAERNAMLLALGQLSDAVASGQSYAQPLALVADFAGPRAPAGPMGVLDQHAGSGVLPLSALQDSFAGASDAIIAAAYEAPESDGLVGDVMRNLTQLVIVRSRDPESPGADGIVARAEAALGGGDLAGAVAELEGLEGATAEAAAPWLGEARARLAVDAALAELTSAMDAAPGAAAN